jgi:hypothetical protein
MFEMMNQSTTNLAKKESVDKPGSVVDNHSSGICVTAYLKQPTRIPYGSHVATLQSHGFLFGLAPSGVFPATTVTNRAVRSYRTISPLPLERGGIFSVALSVGSHLPGVTWHSTLWSPDFPPSAKAKSDCLTNSVTNSIRVPS